MSESIYVDKPNLLYEVDRIFLLIVLFYFHFFVTILIPLGPKMKYLDVIFV